MNSSSALDIAFADSLHDNWTAGAHYFQNLFYALRSLRPSTEVRVSLLQREDAPALRYFEGSALVDQFLTIPREPAREFPTFWMRQRNRLKKKLGLYRSPPPRRPVLETYLEEKGVSALFTCWLEFGPNWSFPLLTWIPDFQHLFLPELFTAQELKYRDALFARISANATRVVLSSETARRDFEEFYPAAAAKARVLPFVAQIPVDVYSSDPQWVCEMYHLPERFIYLPNQFWQHKNHELVIRALEVLRGQHPEIVVVCTGNTNDDRAPLYFGKLLAKIAQAGVRDQMILLGWIPHAHLFQLMRQSVAVLQPSLFEGWSTTVEEVKSLGKTIVVSDIPIHREQNPIAAIYFDPRDPVSLANALAQAFGQASPGPDLEAETEALTRLPSRTREFGQRAVHIFRDASRPGELYEPQSSGVAGR